MLQRYTFLIDTKKNVPASERSELAGAEERWRERFTRKSVDFRERAAAVLWTAEPDTVPRPGELRCRPLADCSAAGRMRTEGASSPFGHRGGGASGEC